MLEAGRKWNLNNEMPGQLAEYPCNNMEREMVPNEPVNLVKESSR